MKGVDGRDFIEAYAGNSIQKSILTNFDEIRNIEVGIACKQHKPQQDTELMGYMCVLACFSCTV